MSRHSHTSHDKCLNCGEELKGRYCYKCGQDSQEHLDSIWHLIRHFFDDITHYDGKLWKTVKPMLIKPGFLTQEYMRGRRASYLHPVRMFIFLNFIFLFVLLSMPSDKGKMKGYAIQPLSSLDSLKRTAAISDSAQQEVKIGHVAAIRFSDSIQTSEMYDSVQASLPPAKRDGRITKMMNEKAYDLLQSIKKDPDYVQEKLNEEFFHNLEKLTFFFLVMCTLCLALLYRRQHVLMIDHALFSIHLSCTFLCLSILMLLISFIPHGVFINFLIFLYGNYYFYRALRNVYGQPRGKTIWKFIIINFFLFIFMIIGIITNALFAVMTIR